MIWSCKKIFKMILIFDLKDLKITKMILIFDLEIK